MVLRAGGGAFEKLSIPRDTLAAIPEFGNDKINAAYRFGGAPLMVETVEQLLGIEINHVAIVDFAGFRDLIDSMGGIDIELDRPVCNEISGGTFNINFDAGEVNLNGEKALALARTRTSTCGEPINDLDRTEFQQLIIQGMKDRLTDPLRIPINFIKGPLIGWNAPKAFVSDMGAFAMPQFVFAAAIGGSSDTAVLEPADVAAEPADRARGKLHRSSAQAHRRPTRERPGLQPRLSRTDSVARARAGARAEDEDFSEPELFDEPESESEPRTSRTRTSRRRLRPSWRPSGRSRSCRSPSP